MRRTLLAIAVIAFALRLVYAAKTGALRNPRFWEQEQMATNIVERHQFLFVHDGVVYRSYAEPMYPFLAAAVYAVTNHSRTALVLVQILIATATVCVTAIVARRASKNAAVAVAAGLMAALHPGLIYYASNLHPFVLDCFFFVAAAAAILAYREEPSTRNGVIAALVIGLGALTRPPILVFLAPLVWVGPRSLKRVALLVAVSLAVVAPWTIRNAVVHHRFMLTRSGSGFVFWLGNNPASSASAIDAEGRPIKDRAPAEMKGRLAATHDELERDRIYSDAAWSFIKAHPFDAMRRFAQRLYYFWWFSPQWGILYSPAAKLVYRGWWVATLILIAVGAFAVRHSESRHGLLLLGALALILSIAQAAFYVEGRHRLAIEPLIIPAAAAGIVWIINAVRQTRTAA